MLLPDEWIKKHPAAWRDLVEMLGAAMTTPAEMAGFCEAAIQQRIRQAAAVSGGILWRNNVGALPDRRGVPVRFGLMNESEQMNARNKSPDLVGIRPVVITQAHVGTVIGQFWARECKEAGWQFSGTAHEVAQLNAINLINTYGGDAKFTTGEL